MNQRDRLIELLDNAFVKCDDNYGMPNSSQVADCLLANGIMVLPCKVGDKVYLILEKTRFGYILAEPKLSEANIISIGLYINKQFILCAEYEEIGYDYSIHKEVKSFKLSDIGTTVFLTSEEAEKTLEEMRKWLTTNSWTWESDKRNFIDGKFVTIINDEQCYF